MTILDTQAAFYYMAGASILSSLLAVTRKNPVHSILWVLALFLHVAGIFLLVGAQFLAVVQVIVYAGAILVFYLFVLMLLDLPGEEARPRFSVHWPLAAVLGLAFVALAWLTQVEKLSLIPFGAVSQVPKGPSLVSISEVGKELMGPLALPFEITSLLLLASIVGAVVLARKREGQ